MLPLDFVVIIFLPNLNPSCNSVSALESPENVNKRLFTEKSNVGSYMNLYSIIKYSPADDENDSKAAIFLRYPYTSNYACGTSVRFQNNYFQFQLGVELNVNQVFKK